MIHTYNGKIGGILLLIVILLSGCLSPQSGFTNNVPNEDQLLIVQTAVEKFSEETDGLLPIRTKDDDTNIFEKYLIDFDKLKEYNLITDIPSNAFENGGFYQYTIIHPEDNPEIKVIDLRTTEELRKVNTKLDQYRSKHIYPPYGNKITEEVFEIDFKKLGLKNAPYVISPYSDENLPIIMDVNGQLYIDYRADLYQALQEHDHSYKEGDDIRYLLTDNSPFVPAYSLPHTIHNEELIITLK